MNDYIMELEKGDKIVVPDQGYATIGEIFFQHIYINFERPERSTADVEFRDENGNYRHWQSWSDGGWFITKDGGKCTFVKEK